MRARAHPGVSALDGLSERLLAAADGLDVALATTESQEDAIYRLRHRQVVEHGWVNVAELPHGTERDGYDSAALHVGAWKGDALVGAMRLVLPRPETLAAGTLPERVPRRGCRSRLDSTSVLSQRAGSSRRGAW